MVNLKRIKWIRGVLNNNLRRGSQYSFFFISNENKK